MSLNVNQRVEKHRERLRKLGLRPLQIWVPDTRRKDFAEECKRQSMLLKDDSQEKEILEMIESIYDDNDWK